MSQISFSPATDTMRLSSSSAKAGGRRAAGAGGVASQGPRSVPRIRAGTEMSSRLSTVGVTSNSSTCPSTTRGGTPGIEMMSGIRSCSS